MIPHTLFAALRIIAHDRRDAMRARHWLQLAGIPLTLFAAALCWAMGVGVLALPCLLMAGVLSLALLFGE